MVTKVNSCVSDTFSDTPLIVTHLVEILQFLLLVNDFLIH